MLPLSTIPSYFRSTLIPQILKIPLSIMAILKPSSASVGSEVSKELAVVLAQRGSLARIVAPVANERLLHIVYKPTEKLYYISPLISSSSPERAKRERFILSLHPLRHAPIPDPRGRRRRQPGPRPDARVERPSRHMAAPLTAVLALGGCRPERDGGPVRQHPPRLDRMGRGPDGDVRRADLLLGAVPGGRVRGEPPLPHARGHRLHHVGAEHRRGQRPPPSQEPHVRRPPHAAVQQLRLEAHRDHLHGRQAPHPGGQGAAQGRTGAAAGRHRHRWRRVCC